MGRAPLNIAKYNEIEGVSILNFPYPVQLLNSAFCTDSQIADRVCVKRTVAEPRYAWGGETHHSVGKIIDIEADGLLIIEIPNRPIPWQADPSDMEKVEDFKVLHEIDQYFVLLMRILDAGVGD